jgi:hypothetical protein
MRRLLPRILLLAVPATLGCSNDGPQTGDGFQFLSPDCTSHVHLTVSADGDTAAPPAQLRIESCRLDADACMDLCTYQLRKLLKQPGWGDWLSSGSDGQVFNTGDNQGVGFPPGDPMNPDLSGPVPQACKVTFDGSTANSEIAWDQPNFQAGCAEPGAATGSGTAGGV